MPRTRQWTDERAFEYLKARYDRGENITRNDFLREDPNRTLIYTLAHQSRFGSWSNFLQAFIDHYHLDETDGLTVKALEDASNRRGCGKRTSWSRELIRKRVLEHKKSGRSVGYGAVLEYDPSLVFVAIHSVNRDGTKKYYKNWTEVLADCELQDEGRRGWNKQAILDSIRQYAKEHGKLIL
jgi:hypothetical protein